ncbi:MAG: hypothetical protein H7339_02980 [Arcicella sp.]|nr:hypothetical protein [Arcicella sp.]
MAFNDRLNSAKQSTMGFFRKLFIGLLVIALLGVAVTFLSTQMAYSEGDRAGVVSKLSKKGYIFKTQEGELNVGAQGQVGNMVSNLWQFTVESGDEKLSKDIEDAMTTGKRVKLHYEQRYMRFSWMGDTEYFVTKVDATE